jgi:malonate transporter and related proteins
MQALINVILPVFLLLGFGYVAAWRKLISEQTIDAIMLFAQNFAVPTLLFTAIARLDLGQSFDIPLLVTFYTGSFTAFLLGFFGARLLFNRSAQDAVAIGFVGMFSNTLLLGLPITERAYGVDALQWNFIIIALHSPVMYTFGISVMEITRSRGQGVSPVALGGRIGKSLAKNPLLIGILSGLLVNLSGVALPAPVWSAVEMMNRAAIPTALFGLGGVLLRYRPEGDAKVIAWVVFASLILHPAISYGLGRFVFELDTGPLRSAVLTASMAPGVNVYLFASTYGTAKRVAASTVLIGTGLSVVTIWLWLFILP